MSAHHVGRYRPCLFEGTSPWWEFTEDVSDGGEECGFVDGAPPLYAIAQNFESVVNLVRSVLPGMKENKWGRIVNVTSISVKQPVDGLILSNAIRAGVTGFAKTISTKSPHLM